jgi:hypothetical protein
VADDTIDTAGDQRVSGLDGDQLAEPTVEHKDWPDPQRTTGSEENDSKPANSVASILRLCFRIDYRQGVTLQGLQLRFRLDQISFG